MKNSLIAVWAVALVMTVSVIGCAQQAKTESSKEAIAQAENLPSVEEKVKFLASEAKAFISQEKYDEAVNTAQYILSKLEKDSQEAKEILAKAQTELKAMAEKKAEELKGDMKKAVSGFGQ